MGFQYRSQFNRVVSQIKDLLSTIHCLTPEKRGEWITAFQYYLIGLRDGKVITVKQYNAFIQMSLSAIGKGKKPFPNILSNELACEIRQILWH